MDAAEMRRMLSIDDRHWWFVGRRDVVQVALPESDGHLRVLDAGCGSGRTMQMLARLGEVDGIDVDEVALQAARDRGLTAVQAAFIESLPYDAATFDLVTCLDVMEHTDDHAVAFREVARVMRPGGRLVVTVPAYQSLWSSHDMSHQHRRRYRVRNLRRPAEAAGLRTMRVSYFNFFLFPVAAAVRLLDRLTGSTKTSSDLELSPGFVNGPLTLVMRIEAKLIGLGIRLPYGLSLLAVFEKPVS